MARPSIGDGCLKDLWDTLIIEPIGIIVNFGTEKGKDAIFEPAN